MPQDFIARSSCARRSGASSTTCGWEVLPDAGLPQFALPAGAAVAGRNAHIPREPWEKEDTHERSLLLKSLFLAGARQPHVPHRQCADSPEARRYACLDLRVLGHDACWAEPPRGNRVSCRESYERDQSFRLPSEGDQRCLGEFSAAGKASARETNRTSSSRETASKTPNEESEYQAVRPTQDGLIPSLLRLS